MIDHMALDETGATSYLFGTTRGSNHSTRGEQIYIWRVSLLAGSSYVDPSSLIIRHLD